MDKELRHRKRLHCAAALFLNDIFIQELVNGAKIQFWVSGTGKCVACAVNDQFFFFTFGCMVQLVQHVEGNKRVL